MEFKSPDRETGAAELVKPAKYPIVVTDVTADIVDQLYEPLSVPESSIEWYCNRLKVETRLGPGTVSGRYAHDADEWIVIQTVDDGQLYTVLGHVPAWAPEDRLPLYRVAYWTGKAKRSPNGIRLLPEYDATAHDRLVISEDT